MVATGTMLRMASSQKKILHTDASALRATSTKLAEETRPAGLDRIKFTCYNVWTHPGVAQLVARLLWEQDAGSSSLPTRTTASEI